MVSSPTPPAPPDPVKTAQAQGQMNKETAIATQNMNAVNQVTPQGSLNYSTSGYNADGTPIKTATTSLSPDQQDIYNIGTKTQQNVAQIGESQSERIAQLLGTPVNIGNGQQFTYGQNQPFSYGGAPDLSNGATESRLIQLGNERLNPMLQQQRSATETDLINRGITPGTEAYDRAMKAVGQQENDARNQLILTGHGQAVSDITNQRQMQNQEALSQRQQQDQEALQQRQQQIQEQLTNRNQPLNEITALMSGSQVSQPNFVNTPQTQVQPIDYGGMVNNAFQGQLAGYQGQVSQQNAMVGGLAGLGGAVGGAALGGWGGGGLMGAKKPWFMGG